MSEAHYLEKKGLKSWLFTVDHKRIGLMYFFTTMAFFLVAGVLALFVRLELLQPGALFSPDTYNKLFTLHGAIMVFLFIIPVIMGSFGNFFLPIMIGARDVAFPRLNLLSYYIYSVGSIMMLAAIFTGGVDTGWTFYTPYSTQAAGAVTLVAFAVFINGFSGILTGLNFIVTLHKMRAPGMTFNNMPLFLWSIYATAIIQVLATPVIGITVLLLAMERILGIGFFDPALGGDPVLFQHFFWFYSHPAVYIMILPGMAIISEVITVFSRKTIFGYHAIAYSSLAIAFISFLVWGHHMFVSGQSPFANMLFSFLTMFVAVPTAIKVYNWTATMYKGSIWLATPMLYVLAFLFMFTIGGLTGLYLAALAVDVHLHDTYFVVAHFHYVMMGGTVMGLFAGIHYWWPKMFGRMYPEKIAKVAWFFVFMGFNITFFFQFALGYLGMPRRYHDYLPEYANLNMGSTIGSWILGFGILLMTLYLLWSLKKGEKAPDNPWGGKTLEWQVPTPVPEHNFHETPVVPKEPYDYGVKA